MAAFVPYNESRVMGLLERLVEAYENKCAAEIRKANTEESVLEAQLTILNKEIRKNM